MNSMWRTGLAAVAIAFAAVAGIPGPAANAKELSEKSIKVLMEYAWTILPSKFTTPDGKVIEVDKKTKKAETVVALPIGAEVIKAGYNSAQAQLCEMWEEQTANFDAMMRILRSKSEFTDQQLLYMTTLHRMTIHMVAGKLNVTKKDNEDVVTLEPITPSKDTCNDERRKRVKEVVAAQIETAKAAKPLAKTAGGAAGAAAPTGSTQKK